MNVCSFCNCIVQLVLAGVFCGNQSNCRICRTRRICRICILIGGMLEWVGIPGDTGTCRIAWKGWNVWKDWNVWNVWSAFGRSCGWNAWNVIGRSCKTHGCISRRSPCLLCVEFLFWNEGLFALCM